MKKKNCYSVFLFLSCHRPNLYSISLNILFPILFSTFLFILFLLFSYSNLSDWRYSAFYDVKKAEEREKTRDQFIQSRSIEFLEQISNNISNKIDSNSNRTSTSPLLLINNISLCILIVTTPRTQPYLEETLSSLIRAFQYENIKNPLNFIQIFTSNPYHSRAFALASKLHLRIHSINNNNHNNQFNWYQQELFDYIQALTICKNQFQAHHKEYFTTNTNTNNAEIFSYAVPFPLALIIEDDMVTCFDLFSRLSKELFPLILNENNSNWLVIRLFVTGYWDGFELMDIPILILCGGIFSIIFYLILFNINEIYKKYKNSHPINISSPKNITAISEFETNTKIRLPNEFHENFRDYQVENEILQSRNNLGNVDEIRSEREFLIERQAQIQLKSNYYCSSNHFSGNFLYENFAVSLLIFSISISIYLIISLTLINRQNLPFYWSRGLAPVTEPTAGTAAMIYNINNIGPFIDFLNSSLDLNRDLPVDVVLNEYLKGGKLKGKENLEWHFLPDLFDHRGVYSSHSGKNQGKYQFMKVSSSFEHEIPWQ